MNRNKNDKTKTTATNVSQNISTSENDHNNESVIAADNDTGTNGQNIDGTSILSQEEVLENIILKQIRKIRLFQPDYPAKNPNNIDSRVISKNIQDVTCNSDKIYNINCIHNVFSNRINNFSAPIKPCENQTLNYSATHTQINATKSHIPSWNNSNNETDAYISAIEYSPIPDTNITSTSNINTPTKHITTPSHSTPITIDHINSEKHADSIVVSIITEIIENLQSLIRHTNTNILTKHKFIELIENFLLNLKQHNKAEHFEPTIPFNTIDKTRQENNQQIEITNDQHLATINKTLSHQKNIKDDCDNNNLNATFLIGDINLSKIYCSDLDPSCHIQTIRSNTVYGILQCINNTEIKYNNYIICFSHFRNKESEMEEIIKSIRNKNNKAKIYFTESIYAQNDELQYLNVIKNNQNVKAITLSCKSIQHRKSIFHYAPNRNKPLNRTQTTQLIYQLSNHSPLKINYINIFANTARQLQQMKQIRQKSHSQNRISQSKQRNTAYPPKQLHPQNQCNFSIKKHMGSYRKQESQPIYPPQGLGQTRHVQHLHGYKLYSDQFPTNRNIFSRKHHGISIGNQEFPPQNSTYNNHQLRETKYPQINIHPSVDIKQCQRETQPHNFESRLKNTVHNIKKTRISNRHSNIHNHRNHNKFETLTTLHDTDRTEEIHERTSTNLTISDDTNTNKISTRLAVSAEKYIANKGLKIMETPGDGHCLLHAYIKSSQHIKTDIRLRTKNHNELVNNIIHKIENHVLNNMDKYLKYTDTGKGNLISDMKAYLYQKNYTNNFADLAPHILAQVTNNTIHIIDILNEQNHSQIITIYPSQQPIRKADIYLHRQNLHYKALIPIKSQ